MLGFFGYCAAGLFVAILAHQIMRLQEGVWITFFLAGLVILTWPAVVLIYLVGSVYDDLKRL